MRNKFYNYLAKDDSLWFEFKSISEKKTVKKIVIFSPIGEDSYLYNLTLVDAFTDGSYNDSSITNNEDMPKVIATVIQILCSFFKKYPHKSVYIEGSSPSRTRLYRIIIAKELSEIEKVFGIYGVINDSLEDFEKNKNYTGLIINLKNHNNLLKLLYENNYQ